MNKTKVWDFRLIGLLVIILISFMAIVVLEKPKNKNIEMGSVKEINKIKIYSDDSL